MCCSYVLKSLFVIGVISKTIVVLHYHKLIVADKTVIAAIARKNLCSETEKLRTRLGSGNPAPIDILLTVQRRISVAVLYAAWFSVSVCAVLLFMCLADIKKDLGNSCLLD